MTTSFNSTRRGALNSCRLPLTKTRLTVMLFVFSINVVIFQSKFFAIRSPTTVASTTSDSEKASATITTTTINSVSKQVLEALFKKTSGENWKVVTFPLQEEISDDGIRWTNYTSTTHFTRAFAVHNHDDDMPVSGSILRDHRWPDCDRLPLMWNEVTNKKKGEKQRVYLDIGGNIGACVMEMLLSTDAPFVVFEPYPKNRRLMILTISRLEAELQERVIIVPTALGDEQKMSTIYVADDNKGNAVVGKVIKDVDAQSFGSENQAIIPVERLDSLFRKDIEDNIEITLLKLDVQGYECRVFDGMSQSTANCIKRMKFEIAKKWLDEQDCTDLLPRVQAFGFEIFDENGEAVKDGYSAEEGTIADFIAQKR